MEIVEEDKKVVEWSECPVEMSRFGGRAILHHSKTVKHVCWHGKGDYFASVMPDGGSQSVIIHQLSKCRSRVPFAKNKGIVQKVEFHPTRPLLFVASQRYVRVYDLAKQVLVKKLLTGCKFVSSMAVHSKGDNLIVGSYDSRVLWFDLDLSVKPYQALRHHKSAARSVAFHSHYPLFASCSDDCSVIVCHGMVYNDLQNALIVPVKILRGHVRQNNMGVIDVIFHPTQPWVFSCGADKTIRLYT